MRLRGACRWRWALFASGKKSHVQLPTGWLHGAIRVRSLCFPVASDFQLSLSEKEAPTCVCIPPCSSWASQRLAQGQDHLVVSFLFLVLFVAEAGERGSAWSASPLCLWSVCRGPRGDAAAMESCLGRASRAQIPPAAHPLAGNLGAKLKCAPVEPLEGCSDIRGVQDRVEPTWTPRLLLRAGVVVPYGECRDLQGIRIPQGMQESQAEFPILLLYISSDAQSY